jgi:hypothetical protein
VPGSIEEWFEDWPSPLAVLETLSKCPTTIREIRGTGRAALAYYGTEDLHFELAREQASALPCRFDAVPGNHPMAFAEVGNILPAATAHFQSAGA